MKKLSVIIRFGRMTWHGFKFTIKASLIVALVAWLVSIAGSLVVSYGVLYHVVVSSF